MISILSLVTSVKDYVEVIHKLIETDTSFKISNYSELGPIITYGLITLKEFILNIFSFNWLKSIWDLPVIIPDLSSAMISEISVLDGYLHNTFNFLDKPISYGETNTLVYSLEKFSIGLINSLFLCIPTGASHLITLRRFVMQGLDAGYIAGLGSICGNLLWITSIIFGWRFFVIPWLSLDIFRYLLGFILLIKYMWESYNEKKIDITSPSTKQKIFFLNFLLSLTEQTSVYPFISNISIGSESSLLESFPAQNYLEFLSIHGAYILGLAIGCLSFLHFSCWFWENPAFKLYMWVISSFKISTNLYYKALNFVFLYLTMICAISNIPYYGLDYTLTNPLGFVQDDRILDQKLILETSFLNSKASDRNTRRNRGRHGRRERWKRRIRKYRTFDASLYDQGIYDLFTIEDLNYGFDRFWLRRKMRNHRVRFRFFPGPWMRSFKKQLAKPRLESYAGPRQEFFRILFEQVYHPSFHQYNLSNPPSQKIENKNINLIQKDILNKDNKLKNANLSKLAISDINFSVFPKKEYSFYRNEKNNTLEKEMYENKIQNSNIFGLKSPIDGYAKDNLKLENSTLRKFVRKINNRLKSSEIKLNFKNDLILKENQNSLYSKRWKQIFSKLSNNKEKNGTQGQLKGLFKNFYQNSLNDPNFNIKKKNSKINLSKQEERILKYKSIILNKSPSKNFSFSLLHPLKFYLKKQEAFERKLRYYTPTIFRKFSIENNAPYFRIMMKRYFYYFKPTLRWEKTMKVASLRKARRKTPASPRKIQFSENNLKNLTQISVEKNNKKNNKKNNDFNQLNKFNTDAVKLFEPARPFGTPSKIMQPEDRKIKPTHNYTIVGKRANRFRYEIYKDVLQHWYYSPFNRLLLKFDVDLFIKRQPNSHFLTKNEENLLHLRRFLLSEHYNTLRWYSSMQHYRSMKTKIGGTKSFASKVYNQQFSGTFKKIRHLFAITPSQSNQSILKFDQPLYNENFNNSSPYNNLQKNLIIHEELFNNSSNNFNQTLNNDSLNKISLPRDLLNQSTDIIGAYLKNSNPLKQDYIKKLIENKDYLKLTEFLYKGQKTRGLKPILNEGSFLNQEKEYLFNDVEKEEFKNLENIRLNKILKPFQQDLWINLLKKWKRKINDQEFLKNYLQRRIDKREKRKEKKEKNLKLKLENLENWLSHEDKISSFSTSLNKENLTTGVNKALDEGILILKNSDNFNSVVPAWSVPTMQVPTSTKIMQVPKNKTILSLKSSSFIKKDKELNNSMENLTDLIKQFDQKESTIYLSLKNKSKQSLNVLNIKNITVKIKEIYQNCKLNSNKFIKKKLMHIFKPILKRNKNLKNWQQKERSLGRQKRSRKEFKVFSKKPFQIDNQNYLKYLNEKSDLGLNLTPKPLNNNKTLDRKKRDFSNNKEQILLTQDKNSLNELNFEANNLKSNWSNNTYTLLKETYQKYFGKKFKRKKSPQRRARIRRNRGVTKKRTLSDSLKREFKNLRKYGEKTDDKKQKIFLSFNSSMNQELSLDGIFKQTPLQRRSKQKKQRFWKEKRSKYSQKSRKYKKRRRSIFGKVRILNKQLKRIKSTSELKNWWWKNFLPNLRATTDSLLQFEKDRQIEQKLLELSIPEILERDQLNNLNTNNLTENNSSSNQLQIGDYDYKPLSIPQAIKLREISDTKKSMTNTQEIKSFTNLKDESIGINSNTSLLQKEFSEDKSTLALSVPTTQTQVFLTNNLPFYAGWDESLRKFVVTNRLLSRRSSGYEIRTSLSTEQEKKSIENSLFNNNNSEDKLQFSEAPLKGMNAATTLYWQIPFTTYDPDQFFALGMDGFAPLGWRRFQFRHSILKSWLYEKTITNTSTSNIIQKNNYIIKNKTNILKPLVNSEIISQTCSEPKQFKTNNNKQLLYKLSNQQSKGLNSRIQNFENDLNDSTIKSKNYCFKINNLQSSYENNIFSDNKFKKLSNKNETMKNIYRRLKKRYKRVKKHPRSPVWFPSGPLLNQVLPVHYIYIFYKRSRLPRDRYIKRRLKKIDSSNKDNKNKNDLEKSFIREGINSYGMTDFTLRKRVKTKRKYHIKKDNNKKTPLIPRRLKFVGEDSSTMRWRPLSRQKINKPIAELIKEQRTLKYKQRKKDEAAKQSGNNKQNPNLRVKQLRRRVQRQIIRSVWRYKPRAGGFVWPGDYLKLEQVKASKLNFNTPNLNNTNNTTSSNTIKVKRKKKRNIQEWQIQPKKYLLQKHNSNVIKKKLQKANRSNKIQERIKEFNLIY